MKQTPAPTTPAAESDPWDDADMDDLREIAYTDDPTGELALPFQLHSLFRAAGYRVRLAAKASPYHPVWVVKLVRTTAEPIRDKNELFQTVQRLLQSIKLRFRKADLTVQRTGDRIVVTFLWPPAPRPK